MLASPRRHAYSPEGGFDRTLFPCRVNLEYYCRMSAKLSKDLADALHAAGHGELEVVDPSTNRTYTIVDSEIHRRAMEALRCQQDRDAIRQGLAEMEAGLGRPVDEAFAEMRSRLGFPHAQ